MGLRVTYRNRRWQKWYQAKSLRRPRHYWIWAPGKYDHISIFFFPSRFSNAKSSLPHYFPDGLGRARTHTPLNVLPQSQWWGVCRCKYSPSCFVDIGGSILFLPTKIGFLYWISVCWNKCTCVLLLSTNGAEICLEGIFCMYIYIDRLCEQQSQCIAYS